MYSAVAGIIMTSEAFVPLFIEKNNSTIKSEIQFYFLGISLLALLSQISISLSWTPVPITGQTFGVMIVALSWGSRRATGIFTSYFILGALGLPVFASGQSGISLGPTFGYLVGMFAASFIVGLLADRGFTRTFTRSLIAAMLGSFIIFFFGLLILSKFVPFKGLFLAGLFPFLIGDLIKNILAASVSWKVRSSKYELL